MKSAIIVLGMILSYLLMMYKFPHAMLSPGELVKGHQKITHKCISCHEPFWGIPNDKCIACHKLSDIGISKNTNTSESKIPFHTYFKNEKCTSCHSDHNGVKPSLSYNGFRHDLLSETVKSQCASCHNKPSDNLHNRLSDECVRCHNTDGWKSLAHFDHNLLQGVDKSGCASCHQVPDDSFHSSFKDNCSKCHNTAKWIPSTFDHSAYFILDQNHSTQCNTCHSKNNFTNYTCYGCHEHSERNIRDEHNEEGIFNLNGCLTCHKSGNKHELKYRENRESKSNSKQKEGNEENEEKDDD
jgi:hypothetical protein